MASQSCFYGGESVTKGRQAERSKCHFYFPVLVFCTHLVGLNDLIIDTKKSKIPSYLFDPFLETAINQKAVCILKVDIGCSFDFSP